MISLLLAAAIFAGPAPTTETGRMAAYIVRINPKAAPYATQLAVCIYVEARRHKLDPFFLAAIAWSESYFQLRAPGSSGERGMWQIMPGLPLLRPAWDRLRYLTQGLHGYPQVDWDETPRELQTAALRDLTLATYLAAYIMAWHRRRCDYPTTARCYARYNSGGARVRWSYVKALARRAANFRRAVDADIP
jgi:hypothetical protein